MAKPLLENSRKNKANFIQNPIIIMKNETACSAFSTQHKTGYTSMTRNNTVTKKLIVLIRTNLIGYSYFVTVFCVS